MRAPRFWYDKEPGAVARALQPFGALYGEIAARRMAITGGHPGAPVVTIGNFVAGGAGKTPTAIAVAQLLMAQGERPVFVSRGYGGRLARGGPPAQVVGQAATEVGDEPILLAQFAPTFVGADRSEAARFAVDEVAPSVLVLDDGLQSRTVEPDIAIAVVDGATGVGNGLCFPAGPLRAPLDRQIARVSAVVIIGPGEPGEATATHALAANKPVLRARLEADERARALNGRKVVAFAGIGLPEKFFATIDGLGAWIAARRAFPDHHRYSETELAELYELAEQNGALLVTTQKDAVRLPPPPAGARAPIAIPVRLVFDDEEAAARLLRTGLARVRPWESRASTK